MHAYCDRQGHPENSVIFLYDGELETAFVPTVSPGQPLPIWACCRADFSGLCDLCRKTHTAGGHTQ